MLKERQKVSPQPLSKKTKTNLEHWTECVVVVKLAIALKSHLKRAVLEWKTFNMMNDGNVTFSIIVELIEKK